MKITIDKTRIIEMTSSMFNVDIDIVSTYVSMNNDNINKLLKLSLTDAYSKNKSDNLIDVNNGFKFANRLLKINKILSR